MIFDEEMIMNTVLTLNIDQNVIENAELYAKHSKKTLSELVEEYLLSISVNTQVKYKQLGPITSQLAGIIKLDNAINHKELLSDVLLEKYL